MILAYLELARPLVALSYAGLVLSGFLAVGFPASDPWLAFKTAGAVALLAMGAAAINDVHDADIDRVNAPARPIPSGRVSPAGATRAAAALFAAGGLLGGVFAPAAVAASLALGAAGCVAYGVWSKRMGPAKNLAIATLAAAACLMPGLALRRATPALAAAAAHVFLVGLAVEVLKDVEDLSGDAGAGARTWAVAVGPRPAARAAGVLAAAGFLVAAAAACLGGCRPARLGLVGAGSALAAAVFAAPGRLKPATALMSACALGLAAIVLG